MQNEPTRAWENVKSLNINVKVSAKIYKESERKRKSFGLCHETDENKVRNPLLLEMKIKNKIK